ncbi:hypothetical protein V6N13_089702 [Hibiscus sabdariffa]
MATPSFLYSEASPQKRSPVLRQTWSLRPLLAPGRHSSIQCREEEAQQHQQQHYQAKNHHVEETVFDFRLLLHGPWNSAHIHSEH